MFSKSKRFDAAAAAAAALKKQTKNQKLDLDMEPKKQEIESEKAAENPILQKQLVNSKPTEKTSKITQNELKPNSSHESKVNKIKNQDEVKENYKKPNTKMVLQSEKPKVNEQMKSKLSKPQNLSKEKMKPQNEIQKTEMSKPKEVAKPQGVAKPKSVPAITPVKSKSGVRSICSSTHSTKSFVTPKPVQVVLKSTGNSSIKKTIASLTPKVNSAKKSTKEVDDIIKAQEVEIRNKDYTISEYNKLIEDLKNEISILQKQMNEAVANNNNESEIEPISKPHTDLSRLIDMPDHDVVMNTLKLTIIELENQCKQLQDEICDKQAELALQEQVITIRDSLCKDLQEKLTNVENCLSETQQRLEMVKGHHALALEANESIRREYKAELEALKSKMEEEKLATVNKYKLDQGNIKDKYNLLIETIKDEMIKEKEDIVQELQQQLVSKDFEMKAKLEQIEEATQEKLRLCEIQFEERTHELQEHWNRQQEKLHYLESETKELRYNLSLAEEQSKALQREFDCLKKDHTKLETEKLETIKELEEIKEESKKKSINFENEVNKLTVEVDKATKEKNKFEMSLFVTRDIVQVLTMRLRESDDELDKLENQVQALKHTKEILEDEITKYKTSLNNTMLECNEYKEALVNLLKSKAALSKEHNRIMEHNVTLIESLQNVEKEAYKELGTIKNELIEDVEMLKQESTSQIKMLREEVEQKRQQLMMATEHAAAANAATERSRVLLQQAGDELARLEGDNEVLQRQIEDQQSLVVELSLLRQENEELTMTVAKQSSLIDKLKKESEVKKDVGLKSPLATRKAMKIGKENMMGKENMQVVSPLRERNH